MTKTIKVEGMMCPHCEAHVKEALEAIKGVAKADASHTEKKVEIVLESEVQNEVLYDAIKKAGYKVIE